jgi:uncharacterized protein
MRDDSRPITGVLVKPAGADCNLRCRYCFYLKKTDLYPGGRRRMSREVLEALIRRTMDGGAAVVSFCWQGGEPSLMKQRFFEDVVSRQRRFARPGQVAVNSLQTNGLLLDDAFCGFLARERFLVGISIDGPRDLHDCYRRTPGDRPSFDRVEAAVRALLRHGVDTNALVMVTDRTVGRVGEVWSSLRAMGLRHLQLIPCLELDPSDPSRLAGHSVRPDEYGDVLCELFDLWVADFSGGAPATFVRWFEALLFGYVDLPVPLCELCPVCGAEVVVEHNGDVYSCDFFVTPEHLLGNVLRDDLRTLLANEAQRSFGARKARLGEPCTSCPWIRRCHGGCPKDRDRDLGDHGRTAFCGAYRRFFEHADGTLRRLADDWRRRFRAPPLRGGMEAP